MPIKGSELCRTVVLDQEATTRREQEYCRNSRDKSRLSNKSYRTTTFNAAPVPQEIFPFLGAIFLVHSALPLAFVKFPAVSFGRFQYERAPLHDLTVPG